MTRKGERKGGEAEEGEAERDGGLQLGPAVPGAIALSSRGRGNGGASGRLSQRGEGKGLGHCVFSRCSCLSSRRPLSCREGREGGALVLQIPQGYIRVTGVLRVVAGLSSRSVIATLPLTAFQWGNPRHRLMHTTSPAMIYTSQSFSFRLGTHESFVSERSMYWSVGSPFVARPY